MNKYLVGSIIGVGIVGFIFLIDEMNKIKYVSLGNVSQPGVLQQTIEQQIKNDFAQYGVILN